jgi:hypothetical protein
MKKLLNNTFNITKQIDFAEEKVIPRGQCP